MENKELEIKLNVNEIATALKSLTDTAMKAHAGGDPATYYSAVNVINALAEALSQI